jgi:hypothetical protein
MDAASNPVRNLEDISLSSGESRRRAAHHATNQRQKQHRAARIRKEVGSAGYSKDWLPAAEDQSPARSDRPKQQ